VRFVLFYHSLISDWNHVTAHGLRGVATELLKRGHSVQIFEPADGWSLRNLREQCGDGLIKAFQVTYPRLRSQFYDPLTLDLDETLAEADVVIAHEWNDIGLLRSLGDHRARTRRSYTLLLHDAPHRSLIRPIEMRERALAYYDGVLASSDGLRQLYEDHSWAANVWTWRDGVDTNVFRPWPSEPIRSLDVVWVGSWGIGERISELNEYLIEPIRSLGLRARFFGARFPNEALHTLSAAGIDYGGWIPDFGIPAAFATARFSVQVPRRMQIEGLPHTPVIRVLQAMACGIPVVSAPWDECETLFSPGTDLLIGHDGSQVEQHLVRLLGDRELARFVAAKGHQAVMERHTCAHRAEELLAVCRHLGAMCAPSPADTQELAALQPPRHAQEPTRSHVPAAWS